MNKCFDPSAKKGVTFTVNNLTSTEVEVLRECYFVRITNLSTTNTVYIQIGDKFSRADIGGDAPLLPNKSDIFYKGPNKDTVSIKSASGVADVHVQPGSVK